MIKQVEKNKQILEHLRQNLYVNLNILHFIENHADVKILIYNNDVQNGVIAFEDDGWCFVATECEEFLKAFLKDYPTGNKLFSSVPKNSAEVIFSLSEPFWKTPCKVYVFQGDRVPEKSGDFKVEQVLPSDVNEINEYYTYRGDWSLEELKMCIENLDSSCVRIDGELAAWCLVHDNDGSLGPLYTKEKFRRMGLAELVSYDLMEKLIAKGKIPCVQIVDDNTNSLNLAAKIEGMEYSHDCIWFGFVE
jgi:hypothetical protein